MKSHFLNQTHIKGLLGSKHVFLKQVLVKRVLLLYLLTVKAFNHYFEKKEKRKKKSNPVSIK